MCFFLKKIFLYLFINKVEKDYSSLVVSIFVAVPGVFPEALVSSMKKSTRPFR